MNITPLDDWIRKKTGDVNLAVWQLQKLNETLTLVRERSSFYRKHFAGLPRELSSLEELHLFPFTTPEDIRANPLRFVCVSQDEISRVVTLQSSGTSGTPKRLYFTEKDQKLTIDFFGVGMSTLTLPGDKVMIFLPLKNPGCVGDLLRLGLQRLDRIPLPYGPVRDPWQALQALQEQEPDCLVGSPTQILGLARRWETGCKPPRSVLLSTDYVPQAIVKVLEELWGCEVYNHYGATEMGLGGGVECEAHLGYHLREADLYFEIIDPNTGRLVPAGEYGEVVFSTLTRRGMPLIRYRLGDRCRFLPGRCPCGSGLRLMERVSGRFEGYFPLNGKILKLADFDEALFAVPDLLDFSLQLSGSPGREVLSLDVRTLKKEESSVKLLAALDGINILQSVKLNLSCRASPEDPGSILKRMIVDQRAGE